MSLLPSLSPLLRSVLLLGALVATGIDASGRQERGRRGRGERQTAPAKPSRGRSRTAPSPAPSPEPGEKAPVSGTPRPLPTGAKAIEGNWQGLFCQGAEYAGLSITLKLDTDAVETREQLWLRQGRERQKAYLATSKGLAAPPQTREAVVFTGELSLYPLPGGHAPMGRRSGVVPGRNEVRVEFYPGSGAFRLLPGAWLEQRKGWQNGLYLTGILAAGEPALYGWANYDGHSDAIYGTPFLMWREGAADAELARLAALTKTEMPQLAAPDPELMAAAQKKYVEQLQALQMEAKKLQLTDVEGRRKLQEQMEALNSKFREEVVRAQAGGVDPPATMEAMTAWLENAGAEHTEFQLNGKLQLNTLHHSQGLYGDELFVPVFGKPIDQLSQNERFALGRRIQEGRKLTVSDRNLSLAFSVVLDALGANYPVVVLREENQRRRRRYQEDLLQGLPRRKPTHETFEELASIEEAVGTHLATLWQEDRQAVVAAVNQARQRLGDDVLLARAGNAIRIGKSDKRTAALELSSWNQRQADLNGHVSAEGGRRAQALVNERLDELLAEELRERVERLDGLGSGLGAVTAGVDWYHQLLASLGFAERRPGVRSAVEKLAARRAADIESAAPAMRRKLAELDSVVAVDSYMNQLLCVPGDMGTKAGASLQSLAHQRRLGIDRTLFLARFSRREQSWMEPDGSLAVPTTVADPPTGEEIRLAFLRETEWLGGKMLDAHSAEVGMPVLRALGLYSNLRINSVKVLRTKTEGPLAFYCEYEIDLRMSVGQELQAFLADSFQGQMTEGMMDMVNTSGPYRMIDRFDLTRTGWRSPTRREHGIQSIADFMDNAIESAKGALAIFGY